MIDALLSHTFNGIDVWGYPALVVALLYCTRCIPTIKLTRRNHG